MNSLIQKIEDIILKYNKIVNPGIIGVNYLEKLKYLINDTLKDLDKIVLKDLMNDLNNTKDQSIKYTIKDSALLSSICLYKD